MAQVRSGGRGGRAQVDGNHCSAEGGAGGEAGPGIGGDGGDATVRGDHARAIGGKGGRGGIGPGGRGGDAHIASDRPEFVSNLLVVGGDGGEASQPDGRGGRGGRAGAPPDAREAFGLSDRAHMRWPYFEPITEPGRGGDEPDTPQYMARRLILEELKKRYLADRGMSFADVWWERAGIPLDWLNEQLSVYGHRWRVTILADEYEFTDRPASSPLAEISPPCR